MQKVQSSKFKTSQFFRQIKIKTNSGRGQINVNKWFSYLIIWNIWLGGTPKKCLEAHFPGLNLALQAPHSLRDYQHFSAPHSGPAKAPFDEENVERRWDFGGWPG